MVVSETEDQQVLKIANVNCIGRTTVSYVAIPYYCNKLYKVVFILPGNSVSLLFFTSNSISMERSHTLSCRINCKNLSRYGWLEIYHL